MWKDYFTWDPKTLISKALAEYLSGMSPSQTVKGIELPLAVPISLLMFCRSGMFFFRSTEVLEVLEGLRRRAVSCSIKERRCDERLALRERAKSCADPGANILDSPMSKNRTRDLASA